MRKVLLFVFVLFLVTIPSFPQVTINGSATYGGVPYPTDLFGGLANAPCQTAARQSASTGIVRAPLDMNNAATGWEGYWHELKVGGRWLICDPMDNAFFPAGFEVPGPNGTQGAGAYGIAGVPSYAQLMTKYGGTAKANVTTYMNARAKRMQAFGFNLVGNNLSSGPVGDLYMPFPNAQADPPVANPPMPFIYWARSTGIAARRIDYGPNPSGTINNWGYVTIKSMPSLMPTAIFGEPQAFPGAQAGQVPNIDWYDIFDPQWQCAQSVYDTDNHGAKPAFCPQTNLYNSDFILSDWIGGAIAGTTETLMNGSSSGPFAPGAYTVTLASNAGLSACAAAASPCTVMIDPGLADGEDVEISAPNSGASTFQVTTTKTHPQGFIVRSGTDWIFAETGEDSDYFGGLVDAPNTPQAHPGWAVLLSAPYGTVRNLLSRFSTYAATTFTQNVTHAAGSLQLVSVASTTGMTSGYLDVGTPGSTSEEVVSLATSPTDTTTTASASPGDVSLAVTSTSGFPTKGNSRSLYIGGQVVDYTSTTATSFTGIPASGTGSIASAISSGSAVFWNVASVIDSTHIRAAFALDHASGDPLVTVYNTGEASFPTTYFGPSGVNTDFTGLTAAISAGGQCLTVLYTQPFSTAAGDNTVTFDPGMKGYDSVTYEDGPYTVDGIGTGGPAGCNGANNVHITAGVTHAHAIGALLETPLGIDEVNHTKAELQAWLEGSGISGSYGTGAGSYDTLTDGTGYGAGNTGICKLDEAWGLVPSSYNCTTLTGWPLTYAGTITQAVTGSATAQTVTVSSTTGLLVGEYLDIDPAIANREMVYISSIGAGAVTGVFLNSHSSGAVVQAGGYAAWGSAGLGTWKEDSTEDPGRDFLDENGFHTWTNTPDGYPSFYDPGNVASLGNTTLASAVSPGSGVTVSVANIVGIRNGTTVYLDGLNSNREAVTATNVVMGTYPAGTFTATVAKSHALGATATSQMYNDLDSFVQHYADFYVTTLKDTVDAALPGVMTNPVDHLENSRYAVWAGMGRNAMMFQSFLGSPGELCVTGQSTETEYDDSGDTVPILVYYRPDAQTDSMFRDLATTSNTAVTAAGSATVNLACAESGAYPCNVPSSSATAYNVTIDPNTASEEVASCTFNSVVGAGNSTMTCTFAKTHSAGFQVWGAIASPSNPYSTGDWTTPTQGAKGQMYYDYWLTGNTPSYCPTVCANWTSELTHPPLCPAFGHSPSNPPPAAYPKDFGNLAGTAGGAWNFQANNGDYPFVGLDWWEMYPISSDHEDYGLFTAWENADDGHEDVATTNCTNWEGFSCGGENQNYGDAVDKVAQANQQIWTNMIGWLRTH